VNEKDEPLVKGLTFDELKEKEKLHATGFKNWTKKEF
jgi:hypothetical protein